MIYDQVQSGQGTKDDRMVPLNATSDLIGPGVMMKPFLREIDGKIIASLVAGTGTFEADPEEVSRKLCAMVMKLKPDVVICGPAFNYKDYGAMCARVAYDIGAKTKIPAFAAMAKENEDVIREYQDRITIVMTPAKGEAGLNDALKKMCETAKRLAQKAGNN